MADQDLTSLDEHRPDGQIDQVLTLDDYEHEIRLKLKAWANVEHSLVSGKHTLYVGATAPATPTAWQIWYNPDTRELLVYHDDHDQWATVEQPTFNYLYNPGFSRFANAGVIPFGWTYYGTATTGTLVPSGVGLVDTHQKFGPFALQINSGNGDLHAIQFVGKASSTFAPIVYWYNRTVSLGCWVWTGTAEKVRILIDAVGSGVFSTSAYHPGDSTWRWLVATLKIPNNVIVTSIAPTLSVGGPGITAYFSNPTFVEGSWCPHVLPSGIVLRSELLSMGSASGAADSVAGGSIYYSPHGAHSTIALASTPTPFNCLISNMRFYISGGAGAGQSYIATLVLNGVDTPLSCIVADLSTFNFDNVNKVLANAGDTLSVKVTGTAGAVIGAVRTTCLIEEIPLATA